MDIFQQEKRNFSEMQALQVAANVSRRLSELLGREIDIEFKKSYRFYPPGTYNLRKKFKKYEKFTVYIPKMALEFTEEEITAFAAAEYFFMAASSSSKEYLKYIFKGIPYFVLVLSLGTISSFIKHTPAPVTLSSIINFAKLSFFDDTFAFAYSFAIVACLVAGVLAYFYRFKTSGNKEEIYQADKKAAKLLGTPYNLISAFEKIIRSRGKRAGVIAALEEAFRSRIDGRGIYRYIPLLEKRMSLLSLAGFTVL